MIVVEYDTTRNKQIVEVSTADAVTAIRAEDITRVRLDKPGEYQSGCVVYVTQDAGSKLKFEFDGRPEAERFYADLFVAMQ